MISRIWHGWTSYENADAYRPQREPSCAALTLAPHTTRCVKGGPHDREALVTGRGRTVAHSAGAGEWIARCLGAVR